MLRRSLAVLILIECSTSFHIQFNDLIVKKPRLFGVLPWLSMSEPSHFAQDKQMRRLRKAEARMNHIERLLTRKQTIGSEDQKALNSLLVQDTYNPEHFSKSHQQFKLTHNNVFVALSHYCCSERHHRPVFYLDGLDGFTTRTLRSAGWNDDELFCANLFEKTAGLLKECHGVKNVFVGRAEDVLKSDDVAHIPFAAYYLDSCGGSSSPILAMLHAIFCDARMNSTPPAPFAIGMTLTESDSIGVRSLADREQDLTRGLTALAAARGLRVEYVGDDPGRYGLDDSPMRREGITQTIWMYVSKRG
jgi:hypothetical protein